MVRWMLLMACVVACGDDGGTGGDVTATLDELDGIWVERTGDSYRAMELTRGVLHNTEGDYYRLSEGTTSRADPTMQSRLYTVTQYGPYLEMYEGITTVWGVRIDAFDGDRMTTREHVPPDGTIEEHHYVREPRCPLARDGAWMWSRMIPPGSGEGQLDVALGPKGPMLVMGGPNYPSVGKVTVLERLGCGFTAAPLPSPQLAGANWPRVSFGADGQPRMAVALSSTQIGHFRLAPYPASDTGVVPTYLDVIAGFLFDLTVDDAGATWLSHSATPGFNVSKIAADGTVTTTNLFNTLASSALARDGNGNPHVAFMPNTGVGIYTASLAGGTWTVSSAPVVTGEGRDVTGLVIGPDGSFHVAWTAYVNGSSGPEEHARYATNASGSWTTTALGPGRHPDLVLDSQGFPHVLYEGIPDRKPHLATNASGAWVDMIPESPDSPAPVSTVVDTTYSMCAIAIDGNDKIYLGFGDALFGTNAY